MATSVRRKIGRGRAGSGKRLLYIAGGTRKDLNTWRSLPKATRKTIKRRAKTAVNHDILGTMRNIRRDRRSDNRRGQTGGPRRRGDT